jgi:hypothetical protein
MGRSGVTEYLLNYCCIRLYHRLESIRSAFSESQRFIFAVSGATRNRFRSARTHAADRGEEATNAARRRTAAAISHSDQTAFHVERAQQANGIIRCNKHAQHDDRLAPSRVCCVMSATGGSGARATRGGGEDRGRLCGFENAPGTGTGHHGKFPRHSAPQKTSSNILTLSSPGA